jgi:hypothetical protein
VFGAEVTSTEFAKRLRYFGVSARSAQTLHKSGALVSVWSFQTIR